MSLLAELRAALITLGPFAGPPPRVFSDYAPDGTTLPYLTILDDVSDTPALSGDGRTLARERLIQVDLWEARSSEAGGVLRDLLWQTLDGLDLPSAMTRCRVRGAPRIPDPDFSFAHRAFTVAVKVRA